MRPAPAAIALAPPRPRPVSLAADGAPSMLPLAVALLEGVFLGHSAGRAGSGHSFIPKYRSLPPVWGPGRRYAGIRHGPPPGDFAPGAAMRNSREARGERPR